MRTIVLPITLLALLAGCDRPSERGQLTVASAATRESTTTAQKPLSTIDTRLLGTWQPYDDVSNARLGALNITSSRVSFAKGLTLRIDPQSATLAKVDPADGARPLQDNDTLCGANPVLSVSFAMAKGPVPKELHLSVHDIATGPSRNPNFDLHRCQTFTYVRDEPRAAP